MQAVAIRVAHASLVDGPIDSITDPPTITNVNSKEAAFASQQVRVRFRPPLNRNIAQSLHEAIKHLHGASNAAHKIQIQIQIQNILVTQVKPATS